MAADARLADHARDCVQLLVNVHATRLVVRVDGRARGLRPFDGMVIRPRQTYAIPGPASATPATPGFILVKLEGAAGATRLLDDTGRVPVRALSKAARDDAAQLVADLLLETPDAGSVERGVLALQAAMAPLLDAIVPADRAAGLQADIARDAELIGLDDLQEYGLLRRAAAHGISERHFLTMFRRATQLPPRAYYNMRRLEAAFALLGDASRPIADIAYHLGFSAPPHFTRFMRSNTGWTPSGYRARIEHLPAPLRPRWSRESV
jgi:AraC-like DNA-binding protein